VTKWRSGQAKSPALFTVISPRVERKSFLLYDEGTGVYNLRNIHLFLRL